MTDIGVVASPSSGLRWYDKTPRRWLHVVLRGAVVLIASFVLHPIFNSDVDHYFKLLRDISFTNLPYRDFQWEFPPLTAFTGLLIPISFDSLEVFTVFFILAAVVCEMFTMRFTIRYVKEEDQARFSWYWLGVFVPLSSIAYFRFDWAASVFAALAMVGLLTNHRARTVWGVFLGFAVKMWSVVVLVPLAARRKFKTAAISVIACLLLLVVWHWFSPSGFEAFLQYRKGSAFQIESIPGALVMLLGSYDSYFQYGAIMVSDIGWNWLQVAMPGFFILLALVSFVATWRTPTNLVALVGGLVLALTLTSRLFSPQYLVWMAPFIAVLAVRHRKIGIGFAVASLMTLVEIQFYSLFSGGNRWMAALVVLRNFVLVYVTVEIFRITWGDKVDAEDQDIDSEPDGFQDLLDRVGIR